MGTIIYCVLDPDHAAALDDLRDHYAQFDPRVEVLLERRRDEPGEPGDDRRRMAIPRALPPLPPRLARRAGTPQWVQHTVMVGSDAGGHTLEQILEGVRARDDAASTELYWRVYERMYSRLTFVLGDTDELAGAVALAFGKVLDALEYGPRMDFDRLLYDALDTAAAEILDRRVVIEIPDGGLGIADRALDEPVRVEAPDPLAEVRARSERGRLLRLLGGDVKGIEHVGSTAVRDVGGRPIVDLLIGLEDWSGAAGVVGCLVSDGYEDCGTAGVARRHYLRRRVGAAFDLHVVDYGGGLWDDTLALRAHLRRNPSEADRWSEVKEAAARYAGGSSARYYDLRRLALEELLASAHQGVLDT